MPKEADSIVPPVQLKRRTRASDVEITTPPRKSQRVTRSSTTTPIRKAARSTPQTTPKRQPRRPVPEEELWSVSDIICEDIRDNRLYVLVVWSGINPATGEPWEHTYEPADGVGHVLRRGWKLKKAAIFDAVGVKAREIAARKTIHSYLADVGVKTTEYKLQLKSGEKDNSILAQESPWYESATFPNPEVKHFISRTVLSSSEAEPSSGLSPPPSQLDSDGFSVTSPGALPLSASEVHEISSHESPARNQTLTINLPPPVSQPEAYQLVTASQLQESHGPDTQEVDYEIESAQGTEASSIEEQKPVIPDSQSLQESLVTHSNSHDSNQTDSLGKEITQSSEVSRLPASAPNNPPPTNSNTWQENSDSVSWHPRENSQSAESLENGETQNQAVYQKNSLGFTNSGRTASYFTYSEANSQYTSSGANNAERGSSPSNDTAAISSGAKPKKTKPAESALSTNQPSQLSSNSALISSGVNSESSHSSTNPKNSVQYLTPSDFASQIPYIPSQKSSVKVNSAQNSSNSDRLSIPSIAGLTPTSQAENSRIEDSDIASRSHLGTGNDSRAFQTALEAVEHSARTGTQRSEPNSRQYRKEARDTSEEENTASQPIWSNSKDSKIQDSIVLTTDRRSPRSADSSFEIALVGGDSQLHQNTFSSLPRAPSQSPANLNHSLLTSRPVTPSLQSSISSLNMSADRQEGVRERLGRRRREIWAPESPNPSKEFSSSRMRDSPDPAGPKPNSRQNTSQVAASAPTSEQDLGSLRELSPNSIEHQNTRSNIYLSLPLEDSAREVYRSILRTHKDMFDGLESGSLTPENPDVSMKLATATTQLFDLCCHMDLVDSDTFPDTQIPMSAATQTDWTAAVSSKCSFLKGFLQAASEAERHIVVYAKPGRFMDILEQFLRGIDVTFSRPEKNVSSQSSEGNIRVTLAETSSQGLIDRADLVIGLDETFDPHNEQVRQVRQHFSSRRPICPSISLVVHDSIEHVWTKKSVRGSDPLARQELMLLARSRGDKAGELQPGDLAPDELGEKLAGLFLASRPVTTWNYPYLLDFEPPFAYYKSKAASAISAIVNEAISATASDVSSIESRKRPRDTGSMENDASNLAKRARQLPNDLDDQSSLEEALEGDALTQEDSNITERPVATASVAREQAAEAKILRADLTAKDTSLRELENELGKLQTRFEEQSKQYNLLQAELAKEKSAVELANGRADRLSDANANLRTERSKLQEDVESLRRVLSESNDEITKRLGELEIKAARVDLLEKHQESSKSELEFVRKNYQEASGAAKEYAEEAADLREENERLKGKASEQATKLRTMFVDSATKSLRNQLKLRDAEKANSDRALQIAQEEIHRLKLRLEQEERRAGMSLNTRSSSLPVQEPGPAALMAAKVLHGAQPSRNLTVGAARGGGRATVSANASRAASPALEQPVRGTFKTSPLQRSVRLAEFD